MSNKIYSILLLLVFISFTACNKQDEPKFDPQFHILNNTNKTHSPSWLNKNIEAYGIVVFMHGDTPMAGKPVRCKILDISTRGIKCQALEKVSLFDHFNCFKICIEKDEIWFESASDIFQTKEDAIQFLKAQNIYVN